MGLIQSNLFAKEKEELNNACIEGQLKDAINIYTKISAYQTESNIFANVEETFKFTCHHGHLDVAQWLYQMCPKMDISAHNESAFRLACQEGHLTIVEWLLQIKPTIHISIENDWAFQQACLNGHLNVAKYLFKHRPNILFANFDEEKRNKLITNLKNNLKHDVVEWLNKVGEYKNSFELLMN
jgi:hypothetical protein